MSLRRLAPVLALALASASFPLAREADAAVVVRGAQATLTWAPAPGDVVEYGIWGVPEGGIAASAPTQRVAATMATVTGTLGSTVTIRVAAYYAGDVLGPFSPDSAPIAFRAPGALPYDLDGNGTVDRVYRDDQTGALLAFLVDGETSFGGAVLDRGAHPGLEIAGSADFDGDGMADLVASDPTTGHAELWTMNGTQIRARTAIADLGPGWYARAIGDANADGTTRLLWRDTNTGETQLWSMQAAQVMAQAPLLPLGERWSVWASCDLDGNGFRDVVWLDTTRNFARAWLLADGDAADEIEITHVGEGWELRACGDVDGDGRDVLVWQRHARLRMWKLLPSQDGGVEASLRPGEAPKRVDLAQAGDFDGDGDADLLYTRDLDALSLTCTNVGGTFQCNGLSPFATSGSWQIASW